MSLNQSFNISLGSLLNNQYALTVVSQNIANANVQGYHRQRVDFQTNRYTTDCTTVLSTIKGMNGASIASLTGFIDEGAFRDVINSNSDANYYNTLSGALSDLEKVADDLGDNGLNSLLNDFYAASANLEKYPTDITMRQQYIQAAQNVCEKFNDVSKKYDSLLTDNCENVSSSVQNINSLLQKLADTNREHVKNGSSDQTQTLIDDILSELSNYIDVKTDKNPNGSCNFYIGDIQVVQGGSVKFELSSTINPSDTTGNIVSYSLKSTENDEVIENINKSLTSGSLKAYTDFLNGTDTSFVSITKMKNQLDDAAGAFASTINKIQRFKETDPDGLSVFAASLKTVGNELVLDNTTRALMFTTRDNPDGIIYYDGNGDEIEPEITAGNIRVNAKMFDNPNLVAAARIDEKNYLAEDGVTVQDWKYSVGNSDNAVLISAVQNERICSLNGNNVTLSNFLINNAAQVGTEAKNADDKAQIHSDIMQSALNNYNNIVGVNLDEELADMIKYQRAYEASARVFSTVNGLYDVILNMG